MDDIERLWLGCDDYQGDRCEALVATTSDGVRLVDGLRVWTNELKRGTVVGDLPAHLEQNGNPANGPVFPAAGSLTAWFTVRAADSGDTKRFDGGRLSTVDPYTGERA